ncbi:helix-turn-helix domain-containing protein, partial [Paracoccaceae bacterium]|nr:helix-turn-helix domain-containing protein [Paracoccaceae bacterium]MDC0431815.1 helix-turn-helix domain-containing protein [Paracoccaceae bacterium]
TEGERNQVYALKKAGLTQHALADQIGVHKSTICRELKRNKGLRGYRPKQAHRLACARQSQIPRIRILDTIWTGIEKVIREDWSPEQISGHLKDNDQPSVNLEWIYHYILLISATVATFTPTRDVKSNGASAMAASSGVARSRIEYPLINALK